MGDQRLVRAEFEREFAAQEPCQLIFDFLGFGFWSGEPQEMIVGIARVAQPPVPGVGRVPEAGLRRVPGLVWFVGYTADEAASSGLLVRARHVIM